MPDLIGHLVEEIPGRAGEDGVVCRGGQYGEPGMTVSGDSG